MPIRQIFSARFGEAREQAGLTQFELAEKVGLSDRMIRDYEKGKSLPSPEKLDQLCSILNKEAWWFFLPDGTDSQPTAEEAVRLIRKGLSALELLDLSQAQALVIESQPPAENAPLRGRAKSADRPDRGLRQKDTCAQSDSG